MRKQKIGNRRTDRGRYFRSRKEALRRGEHRAGREEIEELLVMSRSRDPEERFVAADNLCPCHVRTRIEEVQDALYRLMEDRDARVRRAAWHTLEDGGYPRGDARLDAILKRAVESETDKGVRVLIEEFARPLREREQFLEKVQDRAMAGPRYGERGRCDFCGEPDLPVRRDFENPLSFGGEARPAFLCEACDRPQQDR